MEHPRASLMDEVAEVGHECRCVEVPYDHMARRAAGSLSGARVLDVTTKDIGRGIIHTLEFLADGLEGMKEHR